MKPAAKQFFENSGQDLEVETRPAKVRDIRDALRIDGRVEAELRWRWHFADGEIMSIPGHAKAIERRSNMEPILQDESKSIRTASEKRHDGTIQGEGGWTEDVGLRCGPVFVSSPVPAFLPSADIDWNSVEAAVRAGRIDAKLRKMDAGERAVLWLAFGARPRIGLLQLGPLCNVVALTPSAAQAHKRSRSIKHLVEWLDQLSAKAGKKALDEQEKSEVAAMQREAEQSVIDAGRAYRAAWV